MTHPSYLALDRAALGHVAPELRAHLDACPECRGYVASLAEPPAAADLSEIRRKFAQRKRWPVRALWAALPVAAAACALLFVRHQPVATPAASEQPYVGAKGFASVWIYVKRGTNSALWDGKQPFFPGDQLRLKLDPGRFQRVSVYSLHDPAAPERLYAGALRPNQDATLPDAWELDSEPGAERLVVVLSQDAVTPIWPDWLEGKAPANVAVLPFTLPKAPAPASDPSSGSP